MQESDLRLASNGQQSSFQILLDKIAKFSAHQGNLQTLMLEIYKISLKSLH